MTLLTVSDFEKLAKEKLTRAAYDYYSSGANDEITLRENIEAYKRKRTGDYKIISHTNDFIKYSRERRKKPEWANTTVDIVYPHENPSGSSSLLGVKAATKKLGYEKVVLIGCSMDTGNLLNKKKSYSVFQKGWLYFKSDLIGKVKSMSGWTRELLGEPTKEWIEG